MLPPSLCLGSSWVMQWRWGASIWCPERCLSKSWQQPPEWVCETQGMSEGKRQVNQSSRSLSLPLKQQQQNTEEPTHLPSPNPTSVSTVPDMHGSDWPTLAKNGQVICKGPAESLSCFLHKPRHKELTQCSAFEEHLKEAERVLCSANRA